MATAMALLGLQLLAYDGSASHEKFANPLLPSGADPWAIFHDGSYYYMHTTGHDLTIYKTTNLANLRNAKRRVVWTPPSSGPYSKNIWAPELHFLRGRWYIYFAADDGRNRNHRLYVLENSSRDPLEGSWQMKGELRTPEDRWAIDGSIFESNQQLYLLWFGWEGTENGRQDIYLCKLKNPWTTEGPRVRISMPTYNWEKIGDIAKPGPDDKAHIDVNEGPEALLHGGRVFVVFSASGCWTDDYALGMVYADATSNLMDPSSWHKVPKPVFKAIGLKSVFAAGHNSFFRSPDGKEDWILYHANSAPGQGCGAMRSPRTQKFNWTADGMPNFGVPVEAGVLIDAPSGTGRAMQNEK